MVAEPIMMPGLAHPAPTDESQESPPERQTRERSKIEFPYYDLDTVVRIAQAVHECNGTECELDQLAGRLDATVSSSAFKMRLSAVRMYGLSDRAGVRVRLTQLGREIVDPDRAKGARARAFLSVPLYRAVYEKFKGEKLPPRQALESELLRLGVSSGAAERARWIFERSAEQAGFFQHGTDRLVNPVANAMPPPTPNRPVGDVGREGHSSDRHQRHASLPSSSGPPNVHPFIQGLLLKLPPDGSEWTAEERVRWLRAAAKIFDLMYGGVEEISTSIEAERSNPDLFGRHTA